MMAKKWKYEVDFRKFWSDEDMSIEDKGIAASVELEKIVKNFPEDLNLDDFVRWFKDVEDLYDFDSTLTDLYDWADRNGVWISTI